MGEYEFLAASPILPMNGFFCEWATGKFANQISRHNLPPFTVFLVNQDLHMQKEPKENSISREFQRT